MLGQEAAKDAVAREAILARLEPQLTKGAKALVGNSGFRRFLKTEGHSHFAIDLAKAEEDAKFDGLFVLRTNTDLDPLAAMLRYRQLWPVEATFRTSKHPFAIRPIFHKLDETIRGHVFCSFLATFSGSFDPSRGDVILPAAVHVACATIVAIPIFQNRILNWIDDWRERREIQKA